MLSKNQLGFLCMFLSVCFFSVMDLIVKWSENYPLGEVIFFRGFFGLIPILFLIPNKKLKNFYYTTRPGLHFLRCLSGLIALAAIFLALRELPLATVVSITYAAPIFTTLMSIFFLSERVGIYRWLAVLIGFIGVVIILEPGFTSLNIYYFYPVIFCIGLSYVAIVLRQLSTTEPIWLIGFYFSFSITISSFFTLLGTKWIVPSLVDFILLSLIGILGGVANLLLTQAYKLSEVSLVTPLRYLALLFAIFFGYIFWDELPTYKTLVGAFFVIFSSIIIYRREIYLKKQLSHSRNE
jgi:drug/metabolite transporter (DMT)-like permease